MGLLAAVTPEGDVYPNISEIGKEEFLVGHIYENSFEEIWHSKRHDEVKATSNKRWSCGECKNCRAISYNMIMEELLSKLPVEMDSFI
jgi:radical SAM protein with 4Fe4S-binding SPASM domain